MKWLIPVVVVILMTIAVLDLASGNNSATEHVANVLGPYVYG